MVRAILLTTFTAPPPQQISEALMFVNALLTAQVVRTRP